MSKKRIEENIPRAIEVLKDEFKDEFKDESIPREFKGYISSFGASIIQSGLYPTLAFYSEQGDASEDRSKLTKLIMRLINKNGLLLEYAIENKEDKSIIKEEIKDAAIALKLALRTFDLKDGGNDDQ